MIADEQRFVRRDAATRERATKQLGVRLADALLLGDENRVERVCQAERCDLAPLPHARAVRDDGQFQTLPAQLVERAPHVVAQPTVAVIRLPKMRNEPLGEAGVEAPRLHEGPVACLFDSIAVIVHLVDVTQEPLIRDTAQLVRERRVLLAK